MCQAVGVPDLSVCVQPPSLPGLVKPSKSAWKTVMVSAVLSEGDRPWTPRMNPGVPWTWASGTTCPGLRSGTRSEDPAGDPAAVWAAKNMPPNMLAAARARNRAGADLKSKGLTREAYHLIQAPVPRE